MSNCPRYFNSDFDNLKYQFPGSENIANNYAQSMQDMFVLSMLDGKKNGVYVEIGADQPRVISNTYLLETEFDWMGVSFELEGDKVQFFNTMRRNQCICADATKFDYKFLFEERNYPKQIDYLQLDIEPAEQTLNALKALLWMNIDTLSSHMKLMSIVMGLDIQDEQARILKSHGYQLVAKNVMNEGNPYEDWWVDPAVVPEERWKPYKTMLGMDCKEVICK